MADLAPPEGYVPAAPAAQDLAPPQGYVPATPDEMRAPRPGEGIKTPNATTIDDPAYGASNLQIARASLEPNIEKQIPIYANYFGQDPGQFRVNNGEIERWIPDKGEFAKVVPTIGGGSGLLDKFNRAQYQASSLAGPSVSAFTGAGAGALTGESGAEVPAAGVGSALGDLGRQALSKIIQGEDPLTKDYDWRNAALQGVTGSVGQGAGRFLAGQTPTMFRPLPSVLSSGDREALDPVRQLEMQALSDNAQSRGVDLSTGQTTGLPSIVGAERDLAGDPETAQKIYDFAQRQRQGQVPQAFKSELHTLAPAMPREQAIGNFRSGADAVVNNAIAERNGAAAPAMSKALDGKPPFWTSKVFTDDNGTKYTLDDVMNRPVVKNAIRQAEVNAQNSGQSIRVPVYDHGQVIGKDTVPDWRSWDYIRRSLDSQVKSNTNSLGEINGRGQAIAKARDDLTRILDSANPDYAPARMAYGTASDKANMIINGGAGFIKNMREPDVQKIVEQVFAGAKLSPTEIGRMRFQFASLGRQADWNQGLRAYLEGHLDEAMSSGNVSKTLSKNLWEDSADKARLSAALGDPGRVESMNNLFKVIKASGEGLPEGQSVVNTSVKKPMGVVSRAVSLIEPRTLWDIGGVLARGWQDLKTPAYRKATADYLMSPQGVKDLSAFRELSPASEQGMRFAAQILTRIDMHAAAIDKTSNRKRGGRAPIVLNQQ